MKILVIINNMGVGGAEHHILGRLNEMHRRGIEANLITLSSEPKNSFLSQLKIPKSQLHFQPITNPLNPFQIWRLAKLIRGLAPDATITHLWYANTAGRLAAFLAGVPVVIASEHNVSVEKSWKQMLADLILQFFCKKVTADSGITKASLVKYGILSRKIEVNYPAIDLKEFNAPAEYDIREKYGIPKDGFIFLFAGSLSYQKNVFNIIRAFALVDQGFLIIVGGGKDRMELENLVRKLDLNQKVFFTGSVMEVAVFMRQSNCLLFPTRWEGFGLVVAEAILLNLPPIISRNTACKIMVEENVNGLCVDDPENPESIAQPMRRILNEPGLRDRLAKNCGNLPFDLSIESSVNQLIKMIKS